MFGQRTPTAQLITVSRDSNMAFRAVLFVVGLAVVSAMDPPKTSTQSKKCEDPTGHYAELGCRPVYSKRSGKCPERFECPSMLARTDDKKCHYKSKAYDLREMLDNNVNDHACSVDCLCQDLGDGKARFMCAQVECPDEYERWSKPPAERCVYQHKLGDCCSYKEICGAEEKAALATCKYGGQSYREGEVIYPEDECMTCICGKEFDGTLKSLQCSKINCGVEIYHGTDAKEGCAPIYLEQRNCCPIGWRCPQKDDKVAQTEETKRSDDANMKCKYGKETMDVGDEVTVDDACVTCRCSIPPLVTCTRALGC